MSKVNFLRVIFSVLVVACVSLGYTGCPVFEGPVEEEPGPDVPGGPDVPVGPVTGPYAETFWGEWVRVDTGDTWYISGKRILINNTAASKTYNVTKQSPQVISVTESGEGTYFLFASRTANASLRGQVIMMGDTVSASARVSVGTIPAMFISNPQQPEQPPVKVQPDPVTGEFETLAVFIPGDPLVATPQLAGLGEIPPIPVPGIPIPPPDKDYEPPVVPIPVNPEGVNLKVNIRPADEEVDTTLLYADGTSREFVIEVENVGTQDCTAATYSLEWDESYLTVSDPSPNHRLDTLAPKESGGSNYKGTIPLTVTCKPLPEQDGAYKDIAIKVNINYRGKVWEDSDSIRYNRAKIPFRIGSDLPVQGIIKVPGGKTHHFRTRSSGGIYQYTIDLPWSRENYTVIFSGAEVGDEPVYFLGIDAPFPPREDFDRFDDLWRYEGEDGQGHNDDEEHAVLIESKNSIMAYLHGGVTETPDIDFYRINLGNELPEVKLVPMERYGFQEDNGNGDGWINPGETVYLDLAVQNATSQSRTVTVNLSAAGAYAAHVTINKGSSGISGLSAGYYAGLTDPFGWETAQGVSLFRFDSLSNALRFSLDESCPVDIRIPLTLSFTDSMNISWTETIELAVAERDKSIVIETPPAANCVLTEYSGNGDAYVNPGESFYYDIRVKNTGTVSVSGLQGVLSAAGSGGNVSINSAEAYLGTLSPGASAVARYHFTVSPGCPPGTELSFRLTLSSGGQIWWDTPPAVAVKIPTPGGLQASAVSMEGVSLTWNPVSNAAGYRVYYAASPEGAYSPAGSTGSGVTGYSHTGLSSGTAYYYRVTALDSSGGESGQSAAVSAKTWAPLPAFNQSAGGTVHVDMPEYYRFYVSSGVSYTVTSDKAGMVLWESGETWFNLISGTQTQTPAQTGWAVLKFENAGAYTLKITSGEAAVSGFVFTGTSPLSVGTINETDKTIAVLVSYGTSLTALTPAVTAASGWTCATTGAKDFSSPVEYRFTRGDAAQVYTVTVTLKGQGGITINPPGLDDEVIPGFPDSPFTLSRMLSGFVDSKTVALTGTGYSSIQWWVDNTDKSSLATNGGRNFTVQASAYTLGAHSLTVIVYKDGVPWSNEAVFTVTN